MSARVHDEVVAAPPDALSLVLGAPGSGKTSLLVHRLVALVEHGVTPDDQLIITPSRSQASVLRDRVGLELGLTTRGPRVRSLAAVAFSIVEAFHAQEHLAPPDLLQGSQIDADIAAILEGHIVDGSGPTWPEPLSEIVRMTPTFRGELREWMARVSEAGLDHEDILALAQRHQRPQWAAASVFREEFRSVLASARPGAFDSADIVRRAIVALESGLPEGVGNLVHCGIDDVQDFTSAGLDFLVALRSLGVGLTVVAEPDTAGNTFRGSEPRALSQLATTWGVAPVVLAQVHRHGSEIRSVVSSITQRIGTAGAGSQRQASASPGGGPGKVLSFLAPGDAREANDIARIITTAHEEEGIPFDRIAVIARRGARVGSLVQHLSNAGIPARSSLNGQALRDQPVARALLEAAAMARGMMALTPDRAVSLLTGLYGAMTNSELRRLRFALRVGADPELPYQPVDALIAEALGHRGGFALLDSAVSRKAEALAALLDDVRQEPGSTPITDLLWTIWEGSGAAATLRAQTASRGTSRGFAHQALDSVVALFRQASDFVDASPGANSEVFLESLLMADVPDDVIVPQPSWPAVLVSTPPGVAGSEFDLVCVTGVNDQVWPDLRLRGSLLAPHRVAGAARGEDNTIDERRMVLEDELRLFALAVSRARQTLVISASESEESRPSPLFDVVDAFATRVESLATPPLSPRSLVGGLRRDLVQALESGKDTAAMAGDLALLARASVAGAHPSKWWGLAPLSSTKALYHEGPIPISPSALATIEESPIEWFLGSLARNESSPDRGLGTLLHQAWEEHPEGSVAAIAGIVDKRFLELEYEAGWIEAYQRRVAHGMIAALGDYCADRVAEGWRVLASEQGFEVTVGPAILRGTLDRLEINARGEVQIVDLKTGAGKTDNAIALNPQLFAYQLGLSSDQIAEVLPPGDTVMAGAALLFVKEGVRGKSYRLSLQPPMEPTTREEFVSRIEKAATVVAAAEFAGEPLSFGPLGTPPRHRWHFIAQVCGDA